MHDRFYDDLEEEGGTPIKAPDHVIAKSIAIGIGDTAETADARMRELIHAAKRDGKIFRAGLLLFARMIAFKFRVMMAECRKLMSEFLELVTHLEDGKSKDHVEFWALNTAIGWGVSEKHHAKRLRELQQRFQQRQPK